MNEISSITLALQMIIALFKEGLINEATYKKIMKKYKKEAQTVS